MDQLLLMFLCARAWGKHQWDSQKLYCWPSSALGRVLMNCNENSRWLWAGYILQTAGASPHFSSIFSVILYKVYKHGTHTVQTSYLFSVNDSHHQIHDAAQFPHLFLFPFPPTLLQFITSKCDLHHVDCKICGPATVFMHLYNTQHSVILILIWDCYSEHCSL